MRVRLSVIITSVLSIGIGIITVFGLLIGDGIDNTTGLLAGVNFPLTNTPFTVLRSYAEVFLRVAVLALALSVLVGVSNLFLTNLRRIVRGATPMARLGSIIVIGTFIAVLVVRVLDRVNQTDNINWVLNYIQLPIEATLGALLFFALVWGAFRILHRNLAWTRILFVATILIVLVGALPVRDVGIIADLNTWLLEVPVSAGARGILLGIALATVVAGIRILIGQDREYGE
jgi:hypothetical protein